MFPLKFLQSRRVSQCGAHAGYVLVALTFTLFLDSVSPQLWGAAHTVKVVSDVAVTLHIEPNHNPRAGEPAQTWFLLTQKGGQPIPLQDCQCQLAVYADQGQDVKAPILRPVLEAVAAEQFQDLPGANISFPRPGAYRLTLSGAPKLQGTFQRFETSFDVTVAMGSDKTESTAQAETSEVPESQPSIQWRLWLGGATLVLLTIGAIGVVKWRKK